MKKLFLGIIIIILVGAGAFWYFSQRQIVQGKVIDSATEEPLKGVKIKAGDKQKKTNEKGKFSFTSVSDMDKLQVISPESYEKDEKSVPISGEPLVIELTPTLLETRNRVHKAIENNNFDKFWLYFHPDNKKVWEKEEYKKVFRSDIETADRSNEKLSVEKVGNWFHPFQDKQFQGVKRIYPKESNEGLSRYFSSTYWQKKDGYYHFFSNRFSSSQKKSIKKEISESGQGPLLSIKEVKKAPQDSIGKRVIWEGEIVQIRERSGQTFALMEEQETYDMFGVTFDGTTDLLSGDTAKAKGVLETVSSYESQASWNITAPLIRAVSFGEKEITSSGSSGNRTSDKTSYNSSDYDSDTSSCSDECSFLGQKTCQESEVQTCGNYDLDECLEWKSSKTCEYGCSGGVCNSPPLGHSMENPAPANKSLTIRTGGTDALDDDAYKVKVTLLEVIRGTEAWNRIEEASGDFTDPQTPDAGFEYLLAKVKFDLLESKNESSKFTLSSVLFSAVSSGGKEYEDTWETAPEPRLSADLYEGASQTGWLLFEVKEDDSKPLMAFGRKYDGTGGIWFKLY